LRVRHPSPQPSPGVRCVCRHTPADTAVALGVAQGNPKPGGRHRRKQCLKAHGSEESRSLPGGGPVDLVPGRRLAGTPGG